MEDIIKAVNFHPKKIDKIGWIVAYDNLQPSPDQYPQLYSKTRTFPYTLEGAQDACFESLVELLSYPIDSDA